MLKRMIKRFLATLDIDMRLKPSDRALLEGKILPWLSGLEATHRVLFVGCDWYTHGYRKWFRPDTYWTVDCDPEKRHFGAPRLHITDSMANTAKYFTAGSLDLVICNGVFGWGLNAPNDIEAAISAVHRVLRPGGLFLLGWNDVAKHRPMPLAEIGALRDLHPSVIVPLGVSTLLTDTPNRHTFNLYVNPRALGSA
jgi:SAM-dependent methyltransferase